MVITFTFKILFLVMAHGTWGLASPTRKRSLAPCSGSRVLITGPLGKSWLSTFKKGPSLVLAHQLHLKFHIVVQSSDVYCASFPCGSAGKESACNVGDLGSIPGLERSPGVGKGYPLQYSGLENSMDQELDTTERLSLSLHFWNSKFKLVSTSLWYRVHTIW